MRALTLTAIVTLLLCSCNSNTALETCSDKVQQCINNCSFSMPSVTTTGKKKDVVISSGNDVSNNGTTGGSESIHGVLTNRLNMW